MNHQKKIVLTGGGSGGHITPLLSLAHALKEEDPRCHIIYIGLRGEKLEGIQSRYEVFDEVRYVTSGKFRRYHGQSFLSHLVDIKTLSLNVRDFFRVIRGVFEARRLLKSLRPDIVFSKGGYVVVPVGLAARWAHVPLITHDSDAVPGMANRLIGRWAHIHALGMATTRSPYPKDKTVVTGIPIDERIKPLSKESQAKYKKNLGVPKNGLVLLVGGAGLGSLTLNDKVSAVALRLLNEFPNLYIFHIAGTMHEDAMRKRYENLLDLGPARRVEVIGFTPDFYKYSGAADVVLTRAGATMIAELAVQAKATILVPAPFLTGGQQLRNAEELARKNSAVIVANEASPEEIYTAVSELLADRQERDKLAKNISKSAVPDASIRLARLILTYSKATEKK